MLSDTSAAVARAQTTAKALSIARIIEPPVAGVLVADRATWAR